MSNLTFLAPMADALLYQHQILANAKIEQAVPGDRGELLRDPVYDRVLEGLHLIAKHAALPLLDHLLGWRKEALVKATRAGDQAMVLRKRLATEQIFLETSAQIASLGGSPLSDEQADVLEKLSFDWILNVEKYVEQRFPELHRAREKVTGLGAVMIGHLGDLRLPAITRRYLKEVELRLSVDSNSARQEIVQLTEGMRHVRLPTETTAQLAAATDFISKLHPLKHTAVQRKSYVHHSMCEMLTAILSTLAKEDRPRIQAAQLDRSVLSAWHKTIYKLRSDLATWTGRHSKHIPVAYPLMTVLACLEDDSSFNRDIDSTLDMMSRQLKDKNVRTLALNCLWQCYSAYLTRSAPAGASPVVTAYLQRHTKAITQMLRKSSQPTSEQHDAVRQICITIAERAPEFGFGNLLAELLQDTQNWEVLLIGLRSLITLLLKAPAKLESKLREGTEAEDHAGVSLELLDMIRNDQLPLAAYGVPHLTPRLATTLSKVLQQSQATLGAPVAPVRFARTPVDPGIPTRAVSLNVFTAALRCVPYIMPEHWTGSRLMEDLPGYTLHSDQTIRAVAAEVLRRIMRALPSRRNEVVVGMALFAARLSDDAADSISQALAIVDGLMHEWVAILDEKQQGVMKEPNIPGSRRLDLSRLEGIAASLLCTCDADVRRQALELLKTLRTLHRSLLASGSRDSGGHEEEVNYLINIIENVGNDLVRQCYWDFGRWSDFWRVWRQPGDDRLPGDGITFEDSLRRVITMEDGMRWARAMSELMKAAGSLCPATAKAAFFELSYRFSAQMVRDVNTGRPLFMPSENDFRGLDLVRNYSMVALSCPSTTAATKPPPALTTREIVRHLIGAIRNGGELQQQISVFALGYSSTGCYDILVDEIQPLIDDYVSEKFKTPSSRSRVKGTDIRIQTAHIFRLMASNMQPGTLRSNRPVRAKFLEFVNDALRFVGNTQSEIWPDVMLVRYCLCFVVRALSTELAASQPTLFTPQLRRSLFDSLAICCEEGAQGRNRQETVKAVSAARTRHRSDVEQGRQAEADVVETSDYLEHAAHLALGSLLLGPSFDTEAKRHQGRAFGWIERMLTARNANLPPTGNAQWGPSKDAVARSALKNLLSSNHDVVDVSLDQCYSPHPAVSRAYFQVMVEVYASYHLDIKPHLLLSLVLYKMVDPQSEVRDDALHMLGVLSMRVWKEGMIAPRAEGEAVPEGGPPGSQGGHVAVVVGNLQDTYQQFQFQVSAKLAREHPELSEGLCVEMMTRQLAEAGAHTLQHQVLTALAPWMENLSFRPRWEGNWSESLLKSMYYVTLQHGGAFPHEIERLWCTVAANKRNVIPILEFLISRGLQEMNAQDADSVLRYFDVGKRISLYLARVSPQQTIDHLAYEITQLIEADDEPTSAPVQPSLAVYEFHHSRPAPSRQSSHSSFDGRSFHERQRSQSQAASTGTSGLAGLNLMPQSLLPEIMPDIPQMIASSSGSLRRVSEMIRSASSARADVSESFGSALMDLPPRDSAEFSAVPSRRVSVAAPPQPVGRGSMMRAEVAVCLLAEVAYEHDEDFRGHLSLLFHSMLLLMDSTDSLVFLHAQQVVTHLLYSLSVRHLELHRAAGAMLTEYQKVTSLLTYLQAMRGRRLWHYEDVSLTRLNLPSALALSALANAILESIFFERELRERWAAEALKWMIDSNSRHLACRSHQIFRALRPAVSSEACRAMLSCLSKCVAAPSQLALEMAVEIILTLQVMVESMDASRLLLYPQLLLTCFAMLPTTYMHLFSLVIDLLQKILEKLDLNDTTVQHVLLASTPLLPDSAMPQLYSTAKARSSSTGGALSAAANEGWPLGIQLFGREQLLCIQQFMIKGLFKPETELCTVEALACLADQITNLRQPLSGHLITANSLVFDLQGAQTFSTGVGAILGEVHAQLALSIISQLPWLCRHFRFSVHAGLASISILAHARACRAAGFGDLADCLVSLRRTAEDSLASILKRLCDAYAAAFFPRFAKVAIQRLMEVLQKGDEMYHEAVLDILKALLEVANLNLNPASHYSSEADKGLLAPVASLLEGPHSQQALQVLNAIIEYRDHSSALDALAGDEMLQWPKAVGSNPAADTKAVTEAMGRLTDSWGYSRKKTPDRLMPFISSVQFQAT